MKTTVIGAGGWGTTLSLLLAEAGHEVTLWARSEEFASAMNLTRRNPVYLPGIEIPAKISITHNAASLPEKDIYIFAVPSQSDH